MNGSKDGNLGFADEVDGFTSAQNCGIAGGYEGARLTELSYMPNVHFVAKISVVRANLADATDLFAAKRDAAGGRAAQREIESEQLPDGVDAKDGRTLGFASGFGRLVLFSNDPAAAVVMFYVYDPIEQQDWSRGEKARLALKKSDISIGEEFLFGKETPTHEIGVSHGSVWPQ